MKLVIDEKLKHRLIGLCVILSLGAIFFPALMKKSSQRLEDHFSVNVQLPPKPTAPNVAVTDEKEMFKTIKVAQIKTPALKEQQSSDLGKEDFIPSIQSADHAPATAQSVAKIEPLVDASVVAKPIELALSNAANNVVKKQIPVAERKPAQRTTEMKVNAKKQEAVAKKINTAPINKKNVYAVQLASFAKLANAQALVKKLQSQGYTARYAKVAVKKTFIYKVYTGHSSVKGDVVKLRSQLASAMQLNGFVVNTGVS
jgi:DedD protein